MKTRTSLILCALAVLALVAVLSRPALRETLRQNGSSEAKKFDWTLSARRCLDVYSSALAFAPPGRWHAPGNRRTVTSRLGGGMA